MADCLAACSNNLLCGSVVAKAKLIDRHRSKPVGLRIHFLMFVRFSLANNHFLTILLQLFLRSSMKNNHNHSFKRTSIANPSL